MDALGTVKRTIEEHRLIEEGDSVVVGFSGGPDSLCLLHCLLRLCRRPDALGAGERGGRDKGAVRTGTTSKAEEAQGDAAENAANAAFESPGWNLYAVHVNHQLRGKDADADQAFAEEFCRQNGIPCFTYRFDVSRAAREEGLSTEDAGRRLRYQAFEEARRRIAAAGEDGPGRRCLIAVAQNADDQAETVLMRIMRGTGPKGLGAMDYRREDDVIRPLLDVTREEVEDYCRRQGLQPRIDGTNLQPDYTRNRIRLELLPYMKKHFNENIVEALNRLAAGAREDASYIDDAAAGLVEDGLRLLNDGLRLAHEGRQSQVDQTHGSPHFMPSQGQGRGQERPQEQKRSQAQKLEFPLELLQRQPPALRRRMILLLFARLGLARDIGAVHLAQAERVLLEGKTSSVAVFPRGYRLIVSYGKAIFQWGEEAAEAPWRLTREILTAAELGDPASLPPDRRAFDLKAVEESGMEPVLRGRRPGDFIRPIGMKGRKKLQDFLIDRKIPKELRDRLPLVCLGSEVIWVPGEGGATGEPYKVRPDTKEVLLLKICRD